jgi:5,10-methylenetetrahydromethanopterin reductase
MNGKRFEHLGIVLSSRIALPEIVAYSRHADEAGIGGIWVNESHYYRSALSAASAIAASTARVEIGSCVVSVYSRHPSVLAMEAASIDELSRGRFNLGLGATPVEGSPRERRPVAAMREATTLIRGLIAREVRSFDGHAYRMLESDHRSEWGTSLNFAPVRPRLPILFGVGGPQLLELAGAIADGVILTNPSTPTYVRNVLPFIERGLRLSGRRREDFRVMAMVSLSVGDDRREAREAIRDILATYIDHVAGKAGRFFEIDEREVEPFRDAFHRDDRKAARDLVNDRWIDRLAIAGTPRDCVDGLAALVSAGVDTPIAFHTLGPDRHRAIDLLAKEVAPSLSAMFS